MKMLVYKLIKKILWSVEKDCTSKKKTKNITSKYYIKYSKNRETLIQGALYYAIKTTMGTNFLQLTRRN